MPKFNIATIIIIVVALAVAGGIFVSFSERLPQIGREQKKEEITFKSEIRSIAGRVTFVDTKENSFVLLQPKEERSFTVKLTEETEFIRLVFPFDLNNPPPGVTFTPEREVVTIEDLKEGEQVFVRSNSPITEGQDIVNPLEIQILP